MKRFTFLAALCVAAALTASEASASLFANSGFEIAGTTTPAEGWVEAANGYSLSNDAFEGNFSIELASAPLGAAVALQNNVEDGGQAPIVPGTNPLLSFQAKGFAGTTGNVNFALRYLDGTGNILADSGLQFFQGDINPNTWTEITYDLGVVPAGAEAAFIEFSQAIGPVNGVDLLAGSVLIDNVSLVPEPSSMALAGLLGLGGVVAYRRRRRA